MKLILANNQTETFTSFYATLQARSSEPFEYAGYDMLLFQFDSGADQPVRVRNLATNRNLDDYDGIYINGYLSSYELAAALATACDSLGVSYVNKELHDAPSLSKLTMYAKLAKAHVPIPRTIAGTKRALEAATEYTKDFTFPVVLKRADADRGIDNFKVDSFEQLAQLLSTQHTMSLWLLQEFVPNDGFYLLSYYDDSAAFCIFRSLESRPDGNELKSHMYKPKGGKNASLVALDQVPEPLLAASLLAMHAMNRQIGSVDCIYDAVTSRVFVLEVNYNPQLVTVSTFKAEREQALLDYLANMG